jgi:hypothetical protein
VAVNDNGKHSSLLQYRKITAIKSFIAKAWMTAHLSDDFLNFVTKIDQNVNSSAMFDFS